jgi:hypothetical protein
MQFLCTVPIALWRSVSSFSHFIAIYFVTIEQLNIISEVYNYFSIKKENSSAAAYFVQHLITDAAV